MSNTRLASLVPCLVVLAVLASGCLVPSRSPGESGGPSSFSTGDVLSDLAAFRDGFVAASCEWSARCCDDTDFERAFGIIPTAEQTCEDVIALDLDVEIERKTPLLRSGGLVFSPDIAAACLAYLQSMPCGTDPEALRRVEPCRGLFQGTHAPGESCGTDEQCQTRNSTNICEEGICTVLLPPTAPVGGSCFHHLDCDPGTQCFEGRCRVGSPVRATCGTGQLHCAGTGCSGGVCPPPHADGARCAHGEMCESSFCSRRTGTCEPPRCDGV